MDSPSSKTEAIGLASLLVSISAILASLFTQEIRVFFFEFLRLKEIYSKHGIIELIFVISGLFVVASLLCRIITSIISAVLNDQYSEIVKIVGKYTLSAFVLFAGATLAIAAITKPIDILLEWAQLGFRNDIVFETLGGLGMSFACAWISIAVWKKDYREKFPMR